jgi:hypothetical protein
MLKYLSIIISFLILYTGCEKEEQMKWTWDHSNNDPYLDLPFDEQAFIETNIPGVIGGELLINLPPRMKFNEEIESKIQFLNLPEGLIPKIVINSKRNVLRIVLTDTAVHHNADDLVNDLTIIIEPEGVDNSLDSGELIKTGVRILFHNFPVIWTSPVTKREYLLVFNDEFEDSEISKARWGYRKDTREITRTITYEGSPVDIMVENEASVLEDGDLILSVYRKTGITDKIFTGGILTLDSFLPRYGYFETTFCAKYCSGFGYWPAFWLHFQWPDKNTIGTEIDILEYISSQNKIYQTLHWYVNDELFSSSENFQLNNPDEYHVFGLEWTPEELIFYVDGEITRKLLKSEESKYVPSAYQMVYYSMSAGTWGGNVADPSNDLPAYSRFGYCRVYQELDQDAYYILGSNVKLVKGEERKGMY